MQLHGLEIIALHTQAVVPSAWVSAQILLTLVIVLAASSMMYWTLVRRWTSRRQWVALADWGKDHGFQFRRCDDGPPEPLDALAALHPVAQLCLTNGKTTIVQLQTDPAPGAAPPIAGTIGPDVAAASRPAVWHLVIRQIESTWRPTGLRPTHSTASVLDLLSLCSFPLMGPQERFVIFGTDSIAARAVSASPARALLPPDIGLLLHGRYLVVDFSSRPFDPIEFSRMVGVAKQVASRLPATVEPTPAA